MNLSNALAAFRRFLVGTLVSGSAPEPTLRITQAPSLPSMQQSSTSQTLTGGPLAPPARTSETPTSSMASPNALTTTASAVSSTDPEHSMSAFLKALTLIPQVLPVADALVKLADQSLASVPGAQKLQTVLAGVSAFIEKIEQDVSVVTELKSLATPLIEAAVAFNHSPAAAAGNVSASVGPAPAPAAST